MTKSLDLNLFAPMKKVYELTSRKRSATLKRKLLAAKITNREATIRQKKTMKTIQMPLI